jgi:hypothetical protein
MREALRTAGVVLYGATVVAIVVLGLAAASGSLERVLPGTPTADAPPPCSHGRIVVDPYLGDVPDVADCDLARPPGA